MTIEKQQRINFQTQQQITQLCVRVFSSLFFKLCIYISMSITIFLSSLSNAFAENHTQRIAAYEGNPEAQFQLALSYSKDSPNYALAAYWYTQAARQGMANAQYNLGHFYLQGIGVPQDTSKTILWWEQAAHQNYPQAQHNIGTIYFEGIGVKKNIPLAKLWFARCAKLGSEPCKASLRIVEENNGQESDIQENNIQENNVQKNSNLPLGIDIKTPARDDSKKAVDHKINAHILATPNSTIIAILDKPEDYTVLQNKAGWQQIKLNQAITIWVYKSFVSIEQNSDDEKTAQLTGDKVRARTAPSITDSKVLTELNIGTELPVLEETKNWVKLALKNYIAWTPFLEKSEEEHHNSNNNSDNTANNINIHNIDNNTTKTVLENDTEKTNITINQPKQLVSQYSFLDRRSDDEWLFKSNPGQFTLLLGSYDNSKDLTVFARKEKIFKSDQAHLLLAKRGNIEWKYILYGNFDNQQLAIDTVKNKSLSHAYITRIGNIQEQRCSTWKTTIPSPKKLAEFCLKKTNAS